MTLQTFLIWLAIGLVAGWLASAIVGGGYGVIGDIVIGVVGAFVGGLIFRGLHLHAPFGGLPGTIFVAFIGAVVLLVVLRLITWGRTHRPEGARRDREIRHGRRTQRTEFGHCKGENHDDCNTS